MTILSATNLTKRFGGLTAVRNISFEARPGEILSLIGPNGAGKTTVFNLLSGFLRADEGAAKLGGLPLAGLSPEAICTAGLVRTFQIVQPFKGLSVLDNVVMGAMLRAGSIRAARVQAMRVLEELDMLSLLNASAGSLPMGDRKRLEVAKALATNPNVLLLDEVMGGLIPIEVKRMIEFISRLRDRGLTIVVIEHHMSAVMQLSDQVLVLQNGEPIATGTPLEISQNPDVLTAYLGPNFKFVGANAC